MPKGGQALDIAHFADADAIPGEPKIKDLARVRTRLSGVLAIPRTIPRPTDRRPVARAA
jgi:hypothetical protein